MSTVRCAARRCVLPIVALALALGALVLTRPAPASAQQVQSDVATEADLHFERGVEAFRAGRYLEALEHLLASNRLVANKNVVFNIARCFESMGRLADAYRYYVDFLERETTPDGRAEAERAIERIQPRVAVLRVETTPPGATIYLDRLDLGARGLAPRRLALEPGTYRVIAALPGHESATSSPVEVRTGAEASVRLTLRQILGEVRLTGSPSGADVRVDEEDGPVVGRLPATLSLEPGPHVLIVSAPGRQTVQRVVRVVARQVLRSMVTLPIELGTVAVTTRERGATVEIDGSPVGTTPAVLTSIPAGPHRLRVTMPGYRPHEQQIVVSPNERTVVEVQLRSLREVTAASRAAESVEDAPASVTLVGQEDIRAFGWSTVYDALAGVRGIFQTDDGTYQYLGFRGYSRPGDYGNHMLLTLDGHAMNDDQLGASYVAHDLRADLLDVERIEVVRGPGSTLYGTNAFFGVVNVVTRDRDTMLAPHVGVHTEGTRLVRARAGGGLRLGPELGGWISLGGVASQGRDFHFVEYERAGLGDGRSEDADAMNAGSLAARAWLGDLTLALSFNARKKQIPTGAYETILGDPRAGSDDARGFLELRFEPRLRRQTQLSVRVYTDYTRFRGRYPYDDPEVGVVRDSWDGVWSGAEARVVEEAWHVLRLTAGTELRVHHSAHLYSRDESGLYLDERPTFEVFAGYAVARLDAWRWASLEAGARLDAYSTFGSALSPRLAVILRPAGASTLKLMAGQAFRAPSPYELYYNDGGFTQIAPEEGALEPERISTVEAELTHRFTPALSVVVAVFANRIEHLIDTVDTGEGEDGLILQYQNVAGRVHTVGAELEARHEWRSGRMFAGAVSLQRTRQGAVFEDEDPDGETTRFDNSPELLASLQGATPLFAGVLLATRLRFEGPRLEADLETETELAILWDVMLTGQLASPSLEWSAGVRNLADWRSGHPGGEELLQGAIPLAGRTFLLGATASF